MSRRTFPRAVAAGLIAAALGSPAAAQSPNPWRGETLPTAPAPRAVHSNPTRMLSIGLGFNSVGGLTATIEVRDLPRTTPVVETRSSGARPDCVYSPVPIPEIEVAGYTTRSGPAAYPAIPSVVPAQQVIPASYYRVPEYMPPPPPLPVRPIPPAAP